MELLIVDNDTGINDYYLRLLESEFRNVKVKFAAGANKALEFLAMSSCDLVITDTRVGEMSVFEFLENLTTRKIPAVVVSSEVSERLIVECLRAGALDFVAKSNIKLGHLPVVLMRALLEADRWMHIQEYSETKPHRPEYLKINQKIIKSINDEKAEANRRLISQGMMTGSQVDLIDGENYFIVYLYLVLQIPAALINIMDQRKFLSLKGTILDRITEIPSKYGGSLWTRKEDGCFFAFPGEAYIQSILTALEIRAMMNIFNATIENLPEPIGANIGISAGSTVYRENKSGIFSEALNLCAHMAYYNGENNGIMIGGEIYEKIGARAMKYFFKSPDFEGRPAFKYEPVA